MRANWCRLTTALWMPTLLATICLATARADAETIGDRLWIWAHAAGVYNDSFIKDQPKKSHIQPVPGAQYMGIRNLMMIRYLGDPEPPFDNYYKPFKKLDRVVWSLTGASGITSPEERAHVYNLARNEPNITGFILDDFFHEGAGPSDNLGPQWLAANHVQFPVDLTLTPPAPIRADAVQIVQSDWHSHDYRSKDIAVETSADGRTFTQLARTTLPNEGAAVIELNLPDQPLAALRVRIFSTHDQRDATSCGLAAVRLFNHGKKLDTTNWRAEATSSFPGHEPAGVLADQAAPFAASVTPEELKAIRDQVAKLGRPLSINCVVYTNQISPRAKAHLAYVDHPVLWTWIPADLDNLEANLAKLEKLTPNKEILLGCYMYDFNASKPLSVERMEYQTELGLKWLREGRIAGIVFLATPIVDLNLDAVEWTRRRIAQVTNEPLTVR